MITFEQAVEKCRVFLAKMKGADVDVSGRKLLDWLNFEVLGKEETTSEFIIECKIKENMFSKKEIIYKITVDKETGEVKDILRRGIGAGK